MISVHLRDIDPGVVAAWGAEFGHEPSVAISCGNIFEQAADAIVSPANSFGFMDGGIDLVYSHHFGWDLEASLKALLAEQHFGELPVGQAVILPTGQALIPYLVSAPTMRVPGPIGATANVYLAFRAALIAVGRHNANASVAIRSVLVPGFGTGIGGMLPRCAARQMKRAYDAIVHGHGVRRRSAGQIRSEHRELLSYNNDAH
jgi:O-acetyl-ADP-ribose deacetylase (regulator of RNase III)